MCMILVMWMFPSYCNEKMHFGIFAPFRAYSFEAGSVGKKLNGQIPILYAILYYCCQITVIFVSLYQFFMVLLKKFAWVTEWTS